MLAPYPDEVDRAAAAEFRARYPESGPAPVVVLIAAYNEAGAIEPVLNRVPDECLGMAVDIVVVVDGATDATAEVAGRTRARVCDVPVNRGQGAALRLGYHLAAESGARYIVTTDADGQYDIGELPAMLKPLVAGEADFVTGSRVLGQTENADVVRRAGTHVFARLVSLLTGQRVTDTSFGLRAMRTEVATTVTLTQPQYQSSELLIGVLAHGFHVMELPMTMARRADGRTKKGNNLVYGCRYARVVVGTWWRERRRTRQAPARASARPARRGAHDG